VAQAVAGRTGQMNAFRPPALALASRWSGDQRRGEASRCMLRGQTRSQRDIVHPAQWKIASVLGGWMRNGWTRGRVQRRPGIYDMRLTIYGRPVRVVGSEAWVAGESGVASRSAGSATAVQDAPVAGNGSMGSQSPTCHKRHEVWGFPMISNQFQSVLKKLRGESQPRPALAIGGGKIPFAPAGFKGEIKRHASC